MARADNNSKTGTDLGSITGVQVTDTLAPRNPRYKAFAEKYIMSRSASAAAREVGYKPSHAGVMGSQLLKRPDVAQYIAHLKARATETAEVTASRWRAELAAVAFSNIMDFVTIQDGRAVIDLARATPEQARAIQSYRTKTRVIRDAKQNIIGEEVSVEVKLWDKLRALELLGKHSGFLDSPDDAETNDVAERILAGRRRILPRADDIVVVASSDTSAILEGGGEGGGV